MPAHACPRRPLAPVALDGWTWRHRTHSASSWRPAPEAAGVARACKVRRDGARPARARSSAVATVVSTTPATAAMVAMAATAATTHSNRTRGPTRARAARAGMGDKDRLRVGCAGDTLVLRHATRAGASPPAAPDTRHVA